MQQAKFLFIITPPYSGSTALAILLNGSPNSMILNPRGEGQWLIQSFCDDDRWNPAKEVDWELVKRTWLERYRIINLHVSRVRVVIEKSPPNMVRINQLIKTFTNSSVFAFNRDPYANCSSILHREFNPEQFTTGQREITLERLAGQWLVRSRLIRDTIDKMNLLHFTYEEFCGSPETYIKKVLSLCPELEVVDCNRDIKVKDYPVQSIVNQNIRQVALLNSADKDCISKVLSQDAGLVEYFGYSII